MKKYLFLLILGGPLSLSAAESVYHAGEQTAINSSPRWEISLGWVHARTGAHDPTEEEVFSHLTGLAVRGLYALQPQLWVGAEGVFFEQQRPVPANTYRSRRYGVRANYILTPDTTPTVYVTAGAGETAHRLSYSGLVTHRKQIGYGSVGAGIEVSLEKRYFLGAEVDALYHTSQKIDAFTRLNHRWETTASLRGGLRF